MEKRDKTDELLVQSRDVRLAIEAILRESLEEKNTRIRELASYLEKRNARVRALEDEIRSLRDAVSPMPLDPRFWIGLPIGLLDEPCGCGRPETRERGR